MEPWVGPAIVAAVISGLVSLIVVQLNFRTERKGERFRREEKMRDLQIALRAEIASDLLNMEVFDRAQLLVEVTAALEGDRGYVPLLPRLSTNIVFDVVIREVHILPDHVISPLVHYGRLRQSLAHFIEDIRSNSHGELPPERRLLMYQDYVSTYDRLQALAENAVRALENSLGINRTAADPSSRGQVSEGDASPVGKSAA